MEKSNNAITKRSVDNSQAKLTNSLIRSIDEAEALAERVINSDTFGKAFEKRVPELDDKGKPIVDEDGEAITKVVKNKADVVAAIVLGNELGITPMASITLGARLNADAYTKVLRGRKLGLDPMTSINMINIINGVVSTGTHVVTGVLLRNNIRFQFIEDYDPIYGYTDSKNKKVEFDEDKHIVVDKSTNASKLQQAIKDGKVPVFKKIIDRRSSAIFNREGYEPLKISYSLQEATDAGLYKGINSLGEEVEGKPNWNNHPATILRGRVLLIGGRIIAADYLDGMYSNEEAEEITNYKFVDDDSDIQDAKYVDESDTHKENSSVEE